jgi:hypothetical protein
MGFSSATLSPCGKETRNLTCSKPSENNIANSGGILEAGKSHVANNSNGKLGGRSLTIDRNVAFNVSVVVDHSESIWGRYIIDGATRRASRNICKKRQ